MKFVLLLIFSTSWFYKDFERAKSSYESAKRGEENLENPFVYLIKSIEDLESGNYESSKLNFEKAKFLSNLDPATIFLMYLILEQKGISQYAHDLFPLIIKSKEKKQVSDIYPVSEYFIKKSEGATSLAMKLDALDKALLVSPSHLEAYSIKLENLYKNLKIFEFLKTLFSLSPFKTCNPLLKSILKLIVTRLLILFLYSLFFILILGILVRKRYFLYFIFKEKTLKFPYFEYIPLIIFFLLLILRAPLALFLVLIIPTLPLFELKEKILLVISIVLLLISTLLIFPLESHYLSHIKEPNNPYYLKYLTENSPYDEDILSKWDSFNLEEKNLIKSIIYMKKGDIVEAEKLLKNEKEKNSYIYNVNVGNLYFLKGKYDSAGIFYRNAINLNPKGFEAHFNLAQVAFVLVDLSLFEKQIEILNSIDPKKTERYINKIKEYKLLPFLFVYPEKFKKYKIKLERKGLFLDTFIFPPIFIPLSFVILFLIFFMKKSVRLDRCKICLKPIFSDKESVSPFGILCGDCKNEIINLESIKLKQRLAMRLKMKRFTKIKNLLLFSNIILPGLGFVINNSFILFLITSSIFSFGIIIMLFTQFKFFGIFFYLTSILISLIYYAIGGKVNENI
ncbi:MAG: tetratricopeptide repeat protein [Candidatus Hydrothermales bacterium]